MIFTRSSMTLRKFIEQDEQCTYTVTLHHVRVGTETQTIRSLCIVVDVHVAVNNVVFNVAVEFLCCRDTKYLVLLSTLQTCVVRHVNFPYILVRL